jgi:hypothetical protein
VSIQCPENPIHRCYLRNRQTRFASFVILDLYFYVRPNNVLFSPECNVAISTLTVILSAIATNGMVNTDATCLKSLYVGDAPIYYDFRYRHCMTSCQDLYKSSAEQQNSFPFFAAITQRVQLSQLWGLHLPPVPSVTTTC